MRTLEIPMGSMITYSTVAFKEGLRTYQMANHRFTWLAGQRRGRSHSQGSPVWYVV